MLACQFSPQDLMDLERRLHSVLVGIAQQGLALFETTLPAGVKRDRTLVTEADRLLERMAIEKLADVTPEWGFVGEEYGSVHTLAARRHLAPTGTGQRTTDDGLTQYEKTLADNEHGQLNLDEDTYWILDPIDGTIAFLNRIPTWSTLLALVHKGEPVLGVVMLPALNQVFIASKGNGSRMGCLDTNVSESLGNQQWQPLIPRSPMSLAEAFISYSTPMQFAYRGIESFLSVLTEQSYECRSYGDAFGYTRILCGGIDALVDPIVAPYDVAALQILFDETPGCVFTTLHNQKGPRRFRAGNCVAAATNQLSDQIITLYQNHLIETFESNDEARSIMSVPVQPESLSPTFVLPFESAGTSHAAKLWARSVETAIAFFLRDNPTDFIEDVAVLLGSRESASRSLSNGSDEGPPEISASASFHVRAVVSGGSGLSTGTMNSDNSAVDLILSALKSAQSHKPKNSSSELGSVLLASRNQIIGHVGMHPWEPQSFSREFQDINELVRAFHHEETDSRIHSIKSRVNLAVEYRWQYFLDGSQQTFVTHASRISTNATCADRNEKRTAYARYFENHFPDRQQVFPVLEQHFAKVKRQSIDLLSASLVPEEPKYDYLAVDADLLGLILHEAVGHAAEGDLIQTGASGFGENGQMKELVVGPDWMDIVIDGNLENCGYLPVDAEGVQPCRKTIVKNGRLVDAIHTRQTALFARKAPDGCARMQSLQFPSLNRMTSIWVKPHKTSSLGTNAQVRPWDDLSFADIQQALEQQGYLDGSQGVLFLSGWKGGTASCSNLEFRADVARILLLRKGQTPVLMREANFTGIATECFRSAVDAFGPVLCRSIGTCGKDGQGVLTSDGGPAFMVFSPNPKVKVIGTGDSEGADE